MAADGAFFVGENVEDGGGDMRRRAALLAAARDQRLAHQGDLLGVGAEQSAQAGDGGAGGAVVAQARCLEYGRVIVGEVRHLLRRQRAVMKAGGIVALDADVLRPEVGIVALRALAAWAALYGALQPKADCGEYRQR